MRLSRIRSLSAIVTLVALVQLGIPSGTLAVAPGSTSQMHEQAAINDPFAGDSREISILSSATGVAPVCGAMDPGTPSSWAGCALSLSTSARHYFLYPGQEYTLTVSGTFQWGLDRFGDAQCSSKDGGPWLSRTATAADSSRPKGVAVTAAGSPTFDWIPEQPTTDPLCSANHVYRATWNAAGATAAARIQSANASPSSVSLTLGRSEIRLFRHYQCPKHVSASGTEGQNWRIRGGGTEVSVLDEAALAVDMRDGANRIPPHAVILEPDPFNQPGAPNLKYWWRTGHDGVYTCNWPAPAGEWQLAPRNDRFNYGYVVLISGTYRYDITAPTTSAARYATADAECATGYPKNQAHNPWRDDETLRPPPYAPTSGSEWEDAYLHYDYTRYRLNPDEYGPAYWAVANLDLYGGEWRPQRQTLQAKSNGSYWDILDFRIDGSNDLNWRPVTRGVTGPCDPNHAYVLNAAPGGSSTIEPWYFGSGPIHFLPGDYDAGFDNCGLVRIRVVRASKVDLNGDKQITLDEVRQVAPPGVDPAPYACDHHARMISIGGDAARPYFNPPKHVNTYDVIPTSASQYGASVATRNAFSWYNASTSPHSIVAAVDAEGRNCRVALDPSPPQGPAEQSGLAGIDYCDWEGRERISGEAFGPLGWTPAQLDSHPKCMRGGNCLLPGEGYIWRLPTRSSLAVQTLRDANGYVVIPYYCRIRPDSHRGALVISDTAPPFTSNPE